MQFDRWPFEHPELLWFLLLAVPGLAAFSWWSWQKRRWLMSQFIQPRLLAGLTVGLSPQRQKARMALLAVVVILTIVALARPQIGFDWEEARQRGLDVVVAVDTSRSMLAEDIAPNRLKRAKLAALDLKRLGRTDRIGLVAFAGSAFLQCPLSYDDDAFRQSLDELNTTVIPQGGTAIAEAIQAALSAFKDKSDSHKVLVLFTDGEDHDDNAVEAARKAAEEGLIIFTVGVGTPSGEMLRLTDERGRVEFIKDENGNAVKSHLNEELLRGIAQAAGGFYLQLSGANTMNVLYDRGLAPLPKTEFAARRVKRHHERYQWLIGLSLVLLLVEMLLRERRQTRRSETSSIIGGDLRKAVTLLAMLAVPLSGFSSSSQALKKFQSGKYESSLLEYQRLLKKRPDDPALNFNAGAAAYQAKDYDEALKHLESALVTPDLSLQERAYYNMGNTHFRRGEDTSDSRKKETAWQEAVHAYDSALKLDPKDADAQFNLEMVKKKLEELKKQQQQEQQKQGESKEDQEKKDGQQDKSKNDQQSQGKNDPKKEQQNSEDQKPQPGKDPEQQQKEKQDEEARKKKEEAEKEKKEREGEQSQAGKPGDKSEEEGGPAGKMTAIRMTPQQALQLLDTMKNEERTMMFAPQVKTNRQNRVFKDW